MFLKRYYAPGPGSFWKLLEGSGELGETPGGVREASGRSGKLREAPGGVREAL